MSREARFIEALRAIATHPAARGLIDDAAVLAPPPGADLVFTHDMIVEGIHYLPGDLPADVGWKLAAVNLSDLAAKGAKPLGVLLGYPMHADPAWDEAFLGGLAEILAAFDVPLLGGDTVSTPPGAPRMLGLTAIGAVPAGGAPSRSGAKAGDTLWVSGAIGGAGLGLALAVAGGTGEALLRYHRPVPRLALGSAVAPLAHAMADVSDGLLIDAGRIAAASGLALAMDLDAVPVAPGAERDAAIVAGDDYELLIAAPASARDSIIAAAGRCGIAVSAIGIFSDGAGLSLRDRNGPVPLPVRLGHAHG